MDPGEVRGITSVSSIVSRSRRRFLRGFLNGGFACFFSQSPFQLTIGSPPDVRARLRVAAAYRRVGMYLCGGLSAIPGAIGLLLPPVAFQRRPRVAISRYEACEAVPPGDGPYLRGLRTPRVWGISPLVIVRGTNLPGNGAVLLTRREIPRRSFRRRIARVRGWHALSRAGPRSLPIFPIPAVDQGLPRPVRA